MGDQVTPIIITLGGLILNGVGLAVMGTWQLGRVRDDLSNIVFRHRQEIDAGFILFRKEFGETFQALRQKINDVELEAYKVFIRRESFYEVINSFRQTIDTRMDKLEAKLDKMISEKRID